MASRPTRQFAAMEASTATTAIIHRGGRVVRTASKASRMASTTKLIPAKSGWKFVLSQLAAGATKVPGEMVKGMLGVISPPGGPWQAPSVIRSRIMVRITMAMPASMDLPI